QAHFPRPGRFGGRRRPALTSTSGPGILGPLGPGKIIETKGATYEREEDEQDRRAGRPAGRDICAAGGGVRRGGPVTAAAGAGHPARALAGRQPKEAAEGCSRR